MNWRLVFSGLKSPGWTACAILGVAVAIGLSIWLLRLERKLVSRPVGWTLLTLRILVLVTLFVTLLQPVLTKRFDVSQRGKIIIAIDGSLSMETQDRHASLGEKLRWAQALGMLGNAETNPLIDEWVATAESGQEPNWLGGDARPSTPAEQVTVRRSRAAGEGFAGRTCRHAARGICAVDCCSQNPMSCSVNLDEVMPRSIFACLHPNSKQLCPRDSPPCYSRIEPT